MHRKGARQRQAKHDFDSRKLGCDQNSRPGWRSGCHVSFTLTSVDRETEKKNPTRGGSHWVERVVSIRFQKRKREKNAFLKKRSGRKRSRVATNEPPLNRSLRPAARFKAAVIGGAIIYLFHPHPSASVDFIAFISIESAS